MDAAASETGTGLPLQSRKKAILGAAIVAFAVIAVAAGLLCFTYSEYETQTILNRRRDMQQALIDKAAEAIRIWRMELVDQSRFISSSEMFRLFITDTSDLSPQRLAELAEPDALHSDDEAVRGLAEQRAYMQALLNDFVRRRAWNDARIISIAGNEILAPEFAVPLTPVQKELAMSAVNSRHPVFGPVRETQGGLYMDMADPFFEVLGVDETKCIAVLLLTVPMEKPLLSFLSGSINKDESVYGRIVDCNSPEQSLIALSGGRASMRRLKAPVPDGALTFGLREALASQTVGTELPASDVYSIGSLQPMLNWLLVMETPATVVNARIHSREWEIYGLGALATIGLTLLAAFIFANMTSRQYKARAAHLASLYNTIHQQKLILDGVNKSLQAGLLLVDDKGFIQVNNPAFNKLACAPAKDMKGLPLLDVLPASASVDLIGKMRAVIEKDQPETIEVSLPDKDGRERLYRVSLFPYESEEGENSSSGSGCVAIFQDITVFRANAKKAMQRQEALLTAMDRALESIDHNLVGQSEKMAAVSALVADELNMDAAQKDTLRIASLLSQIGKLFVPRELLLKQGKLTPEEKAEVARAPEHADRILRDLHFDLPVRETVLEIGERMDGSGPAGYKAEQISEAGRVLAAVNAFIAMTSPRAWRSAAAMSAEEAILALKSDPRFDQAVIETLSRLDINLLANVLKKN